MDKRRLVSRDPRNPKTIHKMADDCCGNPALDGFTVRDRQGYRIRRDRYFEQPEMGRGLMDETEAKFGAFPSIYNED